jgi:diaminopimelate decarboxylase
MAGDALAPSWPVEADPADPSLADLLAARPHLAMHAFDGLTLEGVPLRAVADALGTPTWVYGAGTIRARYRRLAAALAGTGARIHYAVKANDHLAVLRLIAAEGGGADVVSVGELLRAREAGIPAERIVFSGVGKSLAGLQLAVSEGVAQVNVESAAELEMLSEIAATAGLTVRVALRVNPDVDAGTHAKITTGRADNKFGIPAADIPALYARAAFMPGIEPVGLALHIGSQILDLAPYRAAYAAAAALVRGLRAVRLPVRRVDCGGGLGIGYRDAAGLAPEAFAGALRTAFADLDVELMVEPGRWLVGPAGVLLATVLLTKDAAARRFVVVDAAMNDLLRPAMYEAWHAIVPVAAADAARAVEAVDVVGPVCETADTFARGRILPHLRPGARVGILDAGAYGAVMSSTYNARPLAAQAMVDGERWACIRARQSIPALWQDERVPAFVAGASP